jgi:hypothetical protein
LKPILWFLFIFVPPTYSTNLCGYLVVLHYSNRNSMLFKNLQGSFKSIIKTQIGNPVLLFLLLLWCSVTRAQVTDEILINGSYNESYSEFLHEIGNQYRMNFYYKPEWFNALSVDKVYENITLTSVLGEMLQETPYTFTTMPPNAVIFLPKDEVTSIMSRSSFESSESDNIQIIGNREDIGKVKRPEIKGTVVDGKNSEPIIGAIVAVQDGNYGTTSDGKGNFFLSLTPGIYNLIFSSIGYEQKIYAIKLIGNGTLNVELFDASIKLDEVIVSAQRNDRNVIGNQMSLVELDKKLLKQIPPIFGEKDVIKSLTTMPGVKTIGEFGSGINVRGGSSDQNLFLLEAAPIFNTSHVFGLLSVVSPDAVNTVSLYKGYIPPSYGERISSVMDIQLKEGNYQKFQANGGIGLLNSRLMLELPIITDKASIAVGGRTSYSDWLLQKLPDINLRQSSAQFYDLFGTASVLTDPRNKIVLFGYASNDMFRYSDEIKYTYNNYLGSFVWEHTYSNRLSSKLILAHSRYKINKDAIDTEYEKNRISLGINYSSFKIDFSYIPLKHHSINFGTQVIHYSLNPGEQQPLDNKSIIKSKSLHQEQGIESAIFAGDKYDLGEKVSIQAGVRFSAYAFLGPNQINSYQQGMELTPGTLTGSKSYKSGEIIQKYFNIEPRASLKVLLGETNSVKLSYNHNVQYLNLISYTSISTPDDVWKLCSPFIPPPKCDHFAIGYFQNFNKNDIETSLEIYYKKLNNLIEYKNGAQISMNEMLETALIPAKGSNYGIELLLKKNTGTFEGWISYTYSRSLKQTTGYYASEQINSNRIYPSSYDKPHDLTFIGTYHHNKRLRLTCTYNYASGRAVTLPEVQFTIGNKEYVNFSDRNKYRLPYYQRIDLSISLDETLYLKRKWKGSWTFSVINVLARKNAYSVIYKETEPTTSNNYSRFGLYKLYIIGQPLPTLTYNFIF